MRRFKTFFKHENSSATPRFSVYSSFYKENEFLFSYTFTEIYKGTNYCTCQDSALLTFREIKTHYQVMELHHNESGWKKKLTDDVWLMTAGFITTTYAGLPMKHFNKWE